MDIMMIALSIVGIIAGFFIGRWLAGQTMAKQLTEASEKAQQIIADANEEGEKQKNKQLSQATQQASRLKADTEKLVKQKRKTIEDRERKLKQKENNLKQKNETFYRKEQEVNDLKLDVERQVNQAKKKERDLKERDRQLDRKNGEIEKRKKQLETEQLQKLERIAGMTTEEAKQKLVNSMIEKAETEALSYVKNIMDEAKLKANKEAKKIIIQTIQRTAAEHTIENTVSVFRLETDDVKGQIIGREGRNIRALEAATGVEIIVDDTPEAIVISGYDPVRREIARLALHQLVTDGRIHPARIEEIVAKTRKKLNQQIIEIGERTVIDLNIHGMHPELIRIVGRMRFRSSYGQNLLQHSIETARLCALMASELGLGATNIKLAKRAGLLHDIGKVPEEETELSHALLGLKLTEKLGEHKAVCNAVGAHHDEIEMDYLISPIIQACDAISGARPGARREILESYLKRIKELENLAANYEGVEKAYAIQAGRELRVIVESERVSDAKSEELSFAISQKIQTEMQYPGQIKVTVIREKRSVTYAR